MSEVDSLTDTTGSDEHPLKGLKEYLQEHRLDSVFENESGKDCSWSLFLHSGRRVTGKIVGNEKYEFQLADANGSTEKMHKVTVNFLCRKADCDEVLKQMKMEQGGKDAMPGPHYAPRYRHHIKNKSLYPLMNRKEVLFFKMLGGNVLRGVVAGFSRFEIYLNMKRGVPVVILRHAVLDVRDKKNRSYLKEVVQKTKKYW